MFQQLVIMKVLISWYLVFFVRICIRIWPNPTRLTIRKNDVNDKTFILYAWHLLGAICLEKWMTDPLIQLMREIDTDTNEIWWSNWSSYWVTNWSSHSQKSLVRLFTYIGFRFLSLVFERNPIDTGFREVSRQNWSRQEINRKRVIQVIRVIVRILLLPWTQWVMFQVIEKYETDSFFSVEISWITRITVPSVQTNKPLNINHMSLQINFKPLPIFSKIPMLHAWPGGEMLFGTCTSSI